MPVLYSSTVNGHLVSCESGRVLSISIHDDGSSHISFQQVQQVSALTTALRFLPNALLAIATTLGAGTILHRVPVKWLIVSTSLMSAIAPRLMAIVNPAWSWWYCVFWAVLLGPICIDSTLTTSLQPALLLLILSQLHSPYRTSLSLTLSQLTVKLLLAPYSK